MPKVIATTLFAVLVLTAATAKGFSDYTGGLSLICLGPLLLALDFGIIRFVWAHCYRPQENHLGVVYRFGRFHRFVDPNEWTFLIPYIDKKRREVSLYMRTADLSLKKVELRDGLAVDLRLKVFFKTDLRLANQENLLQIIKFDGPEWPEMIKTSTEDIIRNQVFLNQTYGEMIGLRKNREIKQLISSEISSRMKGFGIIINPDYGAMPVDIQPNSTYFEAVQASRAATPLGTAAIERLKPVMDALKQITHEDARTILLLELASKIVEADDLPELVLSPDDYQNIQAREIRNNGRKDTGNYPQRKQITNRNYPVAG